MNDLKAMLPDWATQQAFLLENWQWLALLLLILACVILDKIVSYLVSRAIRKIYDRRGTELQRKELARLGRPFGLLAGAGLWLLAMPGIGVNPALFKILHVAGVVVASFAGIWASFRLIDMVAEYFRGLADKTETQLDDLLVPMLRKTLKVFVVGFGMVFIADNLNIDMASLLAGMGLGGLAFALAAKDMVANIFGSITVLADRPFKIGDWITVGDVDGTVEDIGLRTTKVRTFYNSLVTMPNANLTNSVIDNYGARRYRRIKTMIGVTYDTPPEKIEAFCEGIRELIRKHPYTRKDYFHVYFNAFAASSLEILLYCFVETPDWSTELREKHRLFVDIVRLAQRLGVEFAFPTQTIWMANEAAAAAAGLPGTQEEAHTLGRAEADEILKVSVGDGSTKPPPVSFS